MAQSVKIILEDDLEGGHADETIQFGLDGKEYEIDLSAANAEKLREAVRPFASAGRRAQGKSGRASSAKTTSAPNPEIAKIRAWAQQNGHSVSDRGRISQNIRDAYAAATK